MNNSNPIETKSAWQEVKTELREFRKALERDFILRRYQKWSLGEATFEDRIIDFIVKSKAYLVTSWRILIKRTLDLAIAFSGLVLLTPFMGLIAIAIKLDSRGPVLLKQPRVGMKGKTFTMVKFRSMHSNAETLTGPIWAQKNDPRVTRVGNFLRKAHLDELPQLFNVLKGDMSIVGPRPERPYFVNEFRKLIPRYDRRLCAKPGITGLAQIKRGYDEKLSDVKKKTRYDILYIQKMCPLLDLKLIALTVGAVLLRPGR